MSELENVEANPYKAPGSQPDNFKVSRWRFGIASRVLLAFVLAAVFGDSVWRFSPQLFGKQEPWDASLTMYFLLMFLGGFAVSLICPRWFPVPLAGMYLGQVEACMTIMQPQGATIFLPVISIAVLGVPPAFIGAMLVFGTSWVRKRIRAPTADE